MRFSARTPADLAPNPLAAAHAAARAAGAVIDLTESNPTTVGLEYPWAAIDAALAAAGAGRYHPEPRGLPDARRAVAAWYAARGAAVDSDHIVLTASTSEAYGLLFKLLCDPGDQVLIPQPSYPLFDHLAAAEAVEARPYRSGRAEPALEARTRAIIVVSPNNPTGAIQSAAALSELADLCAAHDLALIGDEVFADYTADGRPAPSVAATGAPALAFALGGLSKSAGLPQLKLGWIAVAGPPALRDAALTRLDIIADAFLSVATPVQLAASRLLELAAPIRAAIRERVAGNRAHIAAALAPVRGARLAPAGGGWYALIELPHGVDEEALALALAGDRVLVHPGWFFDLPPPCLVASCIVAPEVMRAGLAALGARLGSS
ncbi:MAG TPA: pyridoxal phosphate-dependent aminotransferase [Kofleriaceae bacterium]|nr:pyridoxal phosphate-dependent aminotransferase [Kofleriaceae bacterium]